MHGAWTGSTFSLYNSTEVSYLHKEPSVHLFTYLVATKWRTNLATQIVTTVYLPNHLGDTFTQLHIDTYLGKVRGKYRGL
jgi:hypothetical protein